MSDPISSAALIIAIMSGVTSIINSIHVRKIKCGNCQSDCTQSRSPPNSPHPEPSSKNFVSVQDEKIDSVSI